MVNKSKIIISICILNHWIVLQTAFLTKTMSFFSSIVLLSNICFLNNNRWGTIIYEVDCSSIWYAKTKGEPLCWPRSNTLYTIFFPYPCLLLYLWVIGTLQYNMSLNSCLLRLKCFFPILHVLVLTMIMKKKRRNPIIKRDIDGDLMYISVEMRLLYNVKHLFVPYLLSISHYITAM